MTGSRGGDEGSGDREERPIPPQSSQAEEIKVPSIKSVKGPRARGTPVRLEEDDKPKSLAKVGGVRPTDERVHVLSGGEAPRVDEVGGIKERASTETDSREEVRGYLAAYLAGLLGVLLVGAGLLLATGSYTTTEFRTAAEVLVTPVIGIVGTVVGFYYGGVTAKAGTRRRRT